jgi:hypothetical protein
MKITRFLMKFLHLTNQQNQFENQIPPEHMQRLTNFISIFDDSQFCLEEEPISSLLSLINLKISSPQIFEVAIQFLSSLELQRQTVIEIPI